jgi:hypothetical protein
MTSNKLEPYIHIVTHDDQHFGIKKLDYYIHNDIFLARAEISGDKKICDEFITEATIVLQEFMRKNYKRYGVVHPSENK